MTLWPLPLSKQQRQNHAQHVERAELEYAAWLVAEQRPTSEQADLGAWIVPLLQHGIEISHNRPKPWVWGVSGAQGTGKSTLARLFRLVLEQSFGLRVAILSLDDLYHTYATRQAYARDRHPLFATRGVPGTHDIALAQQCFAALPRMASDPDATLTLPRFDKAIDDRVPSAHWPQHKAPLDLLLWEGWCLGAQPQTAAQLQQPINALEAKDDAQGIWRQHVNQQLQGPYASLFAQIDWLLYLQAPDTNAVQRWRRQQEQQLRTKEHTQAASHSSSTDPPTSRSMDDAALRRFWMHYERLTRHMLGTLPHTADLVLQLDPSHRMTQITVRTATTAR